MSLTPQEENQWRDEHEKRYKYLKERRMEREKENELERQKYLERFKPCPHCGGKNLHVDLNGKFWEKLEEII